MMVKSNLQKKQQGNFLRRDKKMVLKQIPNIYFMSWIFEQWSAKGRWIETVEHWGREDPSVEIKKEICFTLTVRTLKEYF